MWKMPVLYILLSCTFFYITFKMSQLWYSTLPVNDNQHFIRLLQRINDSIAALVQPLSCSMTEYYPQNSNTGDCISGILVISWGGGKKKKKSSCLYQCILRCYVDKIIHCLMGHASPGKPGCSLLSGWPICSDSAKCISKGILRVYNVNSPVLFVFLLKPLLV